MSNIKKYDKVTILSGRDQGKTGKVLMVLPKKNRIVVEGLNLIKKHMRRTREDRPGGIVSKESSIHISNVMLLCSHCNKPSKTGLRMLADGTKERYCKKCQEVM